MNTLSFRRIRTCQSGITLVEMVIAIGIFAIIAVFMSIFQVNIFTTQRVASGSFQTAQDAQLILKTMLVELRSVAPGMNGAYPIASAATSSIQFFSDTNNDGQTEEIGYKLIGTTLYRTSIPATGNPAGYTIANTSTTTLITNVRNATSTPMFQYFDQNYTGTSSPLSLPIDASAVRLIQVNITLDVNPAIAPLPRTYTVQASLRNLKTNL